MKLEEIKQPNLPDIYSTKEVAEFMKIPYSKLYRLIKFGKIKTINVAQSGTKKIFRISGEAIQEYYNSLSNTANGTKAID